MTKNIQVNDMVKAMIASEPCLFNNSTKNLMPVTQKSSVDAKYLSIDARYLPITKRMFAIARWHGALQAKFEVDLFGHSLYTAPVTITTVAHD